MAPVYTSKAASPAMFQSILNKLTPREGPPSRTMSAWIWQIPMVLCQVQCAWADATFELKAHKEKKDVLILSDTDDLTARVDDCVVTMGNILASPHVGPIRSEAEEFGAKLNLLQVRTET